MGGEHDDVLKLVKKLQTAHPGATLKFCYEAGPRGLPRRSLWRSRVKRWFGYTHFLLKGLVPHGGMRTEWSLTTLAYNLKRVLNLVSFEKLMAAVG